MKKRLLLWVFLAVVIAGGFASWTLYQVLKGKAVTADYVLYIPSDSDYSNVIDSLKSCNCISDIEALDQMAEWKSYPTLVKPGRYELKKGMGNEELINKLRIGDQEAISVTFNNVRKIDQLAGKISKYFEADSLDFLAYLTNPSVMSKYGFTSQQFPAMFVPNTYKMNWNTSPEDFTGRMAREFKSFWNDDRKNKAQSMGLSQSQVVALASIVEEETKVEDEKPVVAGVYVNRLDRGMKLQADPTVVFAWDDFTIRRVLDKHKEIDSPYNTYKYKGLPPGPIRIPEITSVDAVLNYKEHKFLYFCASDDFSGRHLFARSYSEHKRNARRYHNALNERKIYK